MHNYTHVVAVRILHERKSVESNLVYKLYALVIRSMVHASLQDTTSVTVSCDLDTVGCYRIVNKL